MKENALIIFIKNGYEADVKTRLAASIGKESAYKIYRAMVTSTIENCSSDWDIVIAHTHADNLTFFHGIIPFNEYISFLQEGDDLGLRMYHAINYTYNLGYKKVTLIGTDSPKINKTIIAESYSQLLDNEVVLGPTFDGGYYLISVAKSVNGLVLFENMKWSCSSVFNDTKKRCENSKYTLSILDSLRDIDTYEDLIMYPSLLEVGGVKHEISI